MKENLKDCNPYSNNLKRIADLPFFKRKSLKFIRNKPRDKNNHLLANEPRSE